MWFSHVQLIGSGTKPIRFKDILLRSNRWHDVRSLNNCMKTLWLTQSFCPSCAQHQSPGKSEASTLISKWPFSIKESLQGGGHIPSTCSGFRGIGYTSTTLPSSHLALTSSFWFNARNVSQFLQVWYVLKFGYGTSRPLTQLYVTKERSSWHIRVWRRISTQWSGRGISCVIWEREKNGKNSTVRLT